MSSTFIIIQNERPDLVGFANENSFVFGCIN